MKNIIKSRENLFSLLYFFFGSKSFQKKKSSLCSLASVFFWQKMVPKFDHDFSKLIFVSIQTKKYKAKLWRKIKKWVQKAENFIHSARSETKRKPIFSWKVKTKMKGFWRTFIFFLFWGGGEGGKEKRKHSHCSEKFTNALY